MVPPARLSPVTLTRSAGRPCVELQREPASARLLLPPGEAYTRSIAQPPPAASGTPMHHSHAPNPRGGEASRAGAGVYRDRRLHVPARATTTIRSRDRSRDLPGGTSPAGLTTTRRQSHCRATGPSTFTGMRQPTAPSQHRAASRVSTPVAANLSSIHPSARSSATRSAVGDRRVVLR